MLNFIFPDGAERQYPKGSSGRDIAGAISKSLEKKAVLIRLDGALFDLDRVLEAGGKLEILTRDDPAAL